MSTTVLPFTITNNYNLLYSDTILNFNYLNVLVYTDLDVDLKGVTLIKDIQRGIKS